MTERPKTSQPFFEYAISTLVWLGQLPIVVITASSLLVIAAHYSDPFTPTLAFALGLALLSLMAALVAVAWRRRQGLAIGSLAVSMLLTVLYLHVIVALTGGLQSPYAGLYLYMPAVVLMVAHRRRWAEATCSIAIFISFLVNQSGHDTCSSWKSFSSTVCHRWYEAGIFLLLLILLYIVNRRMEARALLELRGEAGG